MQRWDVWLAIMTLVAVVVRRTVIHFRAVKRDLVVALLDRFSGRAHLDRHIKIAATASHEPLVSVVGALARVAKAAAPDDASESSVPESAIRASAERVAATEVAIHEGAWRRSLRVDALLLVPLLAAALWLVVAGNGMDTSFVMLLLAAIGGAAYNVWSTRARITQARLALPWVIEHFTRAAMEPALPAPESAPPTPPRPPPPVRQPTAPKLCSWCNGDLFARGDFVAIRAIKNANIDRIGDFAHHACEALVCLGCGRIDWFVKDPHEVLATCPAREPGSNTPLEQVRATSGYR